MDKIRQKVAELEESKKFIQIQEKSQQLKAKDLIGTRTHKSDFILELERKIGTVIYYTETERYSGIMLYGS